MKLFVSKISLILLACVFLLANPYFSPAEEKKDQRATAAEDAVIAALLKTFASAYVTAVDIKKLKEKQISRLELMKEDDFQAEYERVFAVIRQCPQFKKKFGLYEGMSREELIARIISFDRKQICDIINSIPDNVLAGQFREYLSETGEGGSKTGITQQVTSVWGRIKAKAEGR
jgi:hypothetical protein